MELDIGVRHDGKFNIWRRWHSNAPWVIINVVKNKVNAETIIARLIEWSKRRLNHVQKDK